MMSNLFVQNHLLDLHSHFIDYQICTGSMLLDNILYLISPKILESDIDKVIVRNNSFVSTNNTLIDSDYSTKNFSTKFEKKSKNYTKIEDVIEIKKNKNKLSKKNRKTVELDNNERLISSNNVILNEDVLNLEVVKTPKLKKKNKLKSDDSINYEVKNLDEINHVVIDRPITIQDLSRKLNFPPAEVITYLFLRGISVTINQVVDTKIAKEIAHHYNISVTDNKNFIDEKVLNNHTRNLSSVISSKPPIITILGHVDHGKTTLLDAILKTNLVSQEYGGMTQAIKGYEIDWLYNQSLFNLVFVDTPGHDAFISMRLRGIQITDIALLIVAADDGLKPQTIEAINHILSRKLPYIVVINKIDKNDINIVKIKEELAKYNIIDIEWGGDAHVVEVSALQHINIDILLSKICEMCLLEDIKADPSQLAEGIILETYLNKKRGIVANVVVQNGTLKVGDYLVSGSVFCKIKNLFNYCNKSIDQAKPSSIVQVLGFSSMPVAGHAFNAVISEKEAKLKINQFVHDDYSFNSLDLLNTRVTLNIEDKNIQLPHLNIIVRTDTQGSVEAILNAFANLSQQKVQLNVLHAGSGNITNNDIDLAHTSNALVIGFNINISSVIIDRSKKFKVSVKGFNIIYNLLDYVESNMLDLIEPEFDKIILGSAIVQTVFNINKGTVAGCLVSQGKLVKNSYINIFRDNEMIYNCVLNSLKRMKDDVIEVNADNECGVMCKDYNLWKQNDVIEAYSLSEKKKTL